MGDFLARTGRTALMAGAALLVAGCGGGGDTETLANTVDSNVMFEEPANDQSAMEAAVNATDVEPSANESENGSGDNVLGATEGGDTGGNTVESNVSGM